MTAPTLEEKLGRRLQSRLENHYGLGVMDGDGLDLIEDILEWEKEIKKELKGQNK